MKKRERSRRRRRLLALVIGGVALVVGMAVVIFGLGGGLGFGGGVTRGGAGVPLLKNPTYLNQYMSEVAQGLHLSVAQIQTQIAQGKTMPDIAAAQGISVSQLHTIELTAFQHILNEDVQAGGYTRADADQTMQQYRTDPSLLDSKTMTIFSGGPTG